MALRSLFTVSMAATLTSCSSHLASKTQTIYGKDERILVVDAANPVRSFAPAVAMMTQSFKISSRRDGRISLKQHTLSDTLHICEGETLRDQFMLGDCTAFTVGASHVVTARHCIPDQNSCNNRLFVFSHQQPFNASFPERDTYACARIAGVLEKNEGDLALIELDRPIDRPQILTLAKNDTGWLALGSGRSHKHYLLGHPLGLPLIASPWKGLLTDHGPHGFTGMVDATQGSSGSPLVDISTGEVWGVLTRGGRDWVWDTEKNCNRSFTCAPGDPCDGERFTHASAVQRLIINQDEDVVSSGDMHSTTR